MELNYEMMVKDLFNNPLTTQKDRDRIIDLLLKERDKGFVTEEQVIQLIQNYSSTINEGQEVLQATDTTSMTNPIEPSLEIEYKNPKDTHDFLVAYNQDSILKYTCHNIDDEDVIKDINKECGVTEYDFEKHLQVIQSHFNQLRKSHFVDYRILNLIWVYLTGKTKIGDSNEWSSSKIKENWACTQLKAWAENNPHIVPNPGDNIKSSIRNSGYKLSKVYQSSLTGERIINFSELVLYFKSLFHIKADNSLKSILSYINNKEKYHESGIKIFFDENFTEKTELFTNVDTLVQAYKAIIKICSNYSKKSNLDSPLFNLSFFEDSENKICFCIHHLNTQYGKTKNNTIARIGEEQTKLIRHQINGLCDLYIQALFADGSSGEINLWNGKKREYKPIDSFQGVKYIMKFYI